ncbi:DNA replication/repair protein RecF [Arboricoccus pini]
MRLRDFRNYRRLDIETDSRPIILTGDNGAGKTNLLEAISLLAPGRGIRRASLSELTREGGHTWAVTATIASGKELVGVTTGRRSDSERRLIEIEGVATRSQSELAAFMGATWLTPAQDRLFMDSPAARRRFLDRLVLAIDNGHARRVASYERTLRERVLLLRQARPDPHWLRAIEQRLAEEGIAIAAARRELVQALDGVLAGAPSGDSAPMSPFPAAHLALEGGVDAMLESMPAVRAEALLIEQLADARQADSLQGGTSHGPHRSDLRVIDAESGREATACSTGRQKSLLLGIVLAEARLRADRQGQLPIILLDEVVAHLDERRRIQLFDYLVALGAQTWLTGTDEPNFAPLKGAAQFFHVQDAVLIRR